MGGDRTCPDDCPLAVWANLSSTDRKSQRKAIAERLYREGFTQEAIATQLGVSQSTIRDDLRNLVQTTKLKPAKTAGNPKGAGRPKGSTGKQTRREAQPQAVAREERVAELMDVGLSARQIAGKIGLGLRAVNQAMEHVTIQREAVAEPVVEREDLSLSAQHKLDLAVKQHQRKLDLKFERTVLDEIKRRIDEIVLPEWRKQIAEAKTLFNRRKGIMDKETFNMIRRGLHPDSRNAISDKRLEDAFNAFMKLEKLLLDEKNSPTMFGNIPSSLAEWDKMRESKPRRPSTGSTVMKRR
jgi:transposase